MKSLAIGFTLLCSIWSLDAYSAVEQDVSDRITQVEHDLAALESKLKKLEESGPATSWIWQGIFVFAGVILGAVLVGFPQLTIARRSDLRDAQFKCLEGYSRVMDYQAKALTDPSEGSVHTYFRALFDLQWAEFQLWRSDAIQENVYKVWLKQRARESEEKRPFSYSPQADAKFTTYTEQWDWHREYYFDQNDPFIDHMNLANDNRIEEALSKK